MGLLFLDQVFRQLGRAELQPGVLPRAAAVDSLMAATRREVAVLSADMVGAQAYLGQSGMRKPARADRRLFRDFIEDSSQLFMVIDPRPGLHIVDINEPYAAATLTSRRRAAGHKLFDVFPDNPDLAVADGVGNLFESLQRATQSGRPHTMAIQRYDVQDTAGNFVEKHWRPMNIPIFDDRGRLAFLLHHAIDVTPRASTR